MTSSSWCPVCLIRFIARWDSCDRIHLREEARFVLDLEHDPRRALGLAVQNWAIQRELADARLLASAAVAAHDPVGLSVINEWITTTGERDVQLDRTLGRTQ